MNQDQFFATQDADHAHDAADSLANQVADLERQRDSARAWAADLEQENALLLWLHAEQKWVVDWYRRLGGDS